VELADYSACGFARVKMMGWAATGCPAHHLDPGEAAG